MLTHERGKRKVCVHELACDMGVYLGCCPPAQESGRAGRDGLPARSVMFYDVDDRERSDYILGGP